MRTYEDVLRNMGRKEGIETVAKNMLLLGYSVDFIEQATQLPQTVIKKLAKALQPSPTAKPSVTA